MVKRVFNDLTGRRFGWIQVLELIQDPTRYAKYLCRCDCGTVKMILGQSLAAKRTISCGCQGRKITALRATKHGEAGKNRSRTYGSWAAMMTRCEWGCSPGYLDYGACGIRVAIRWHDYAQFLADMGPRPEGTSLDRIDGTRGYEPGNCRWATIREQALNTSRTVRVEYCGENTTMVELCERLGISLTALRSRKRRRGGDYAEALLSFGIPAEDFRMLPKMERPR
jgi:hypothetical protein